MCKQLAQRGVCAVLIKGERTITVGDKAIEPAAARSKERIVRIDKISILSRFFIALKSIDKY